MRNPGNRRWLRPAELARRKGVSVNTVVRHIRAGKINATSSRRDKNGEPTGWEIDRGECQRYCGDGGIKFGDPRHPYDIHTRERSVA